MWIIDKLITDGENFKVTIQGKFTTNTAANNFIDYVNKFDGGEKVELTDGVTVNLKKKTLTAEGIILADEYALANIDAIFREGQVVYILCGRERYPINEPSLDLMITLQLMKKLSEHCNALEQVGGIYVKPECVEGVSAAPFYDDRDNYHVFLTVNGILLSAVEKDTFDDAKRECDRLRKKFGLEK